MRLTFDRAPEVGLSWRVDLVGPLATEAVLMRYCGRTRRYLYLPKLTARIRSKRELRGVTVEVNDGQHFATIYHDAQQPYARPVSAEWFGKRDGGYLQVCRWILAIG